MVVISSIRDVLRTYVACVSLHQVDWYHTIHSDFDAIKAWCSMVQRGKNLITLPNPGPVEEENREQNQGAFESLTTPNSTSSVLNHQKRIVIA